MIKRKAGERCPIQTEQEIGGIGCEVCKEFIAKNILTGIVICGNDFESRSHTIIKTIKTHFKTIPATNGCFGCFFQGAAKCVKGCAKEMPYTWAYEDEEVSYG